MTTPTGTTHKPSKPTFHVKHPPHNTFTYLWALFSYQPARLAFNALTWTLFHSLPLLFGILSKALFDALAGDTTAGSLAHWSPLVLVAAIATVDAIRLGTFAFGERMWIHYWLEIETLLRRNIVRYLLIAKGSRHLPESSGEAVSRIRDEPVEAIEYIECWVDGAGVMVFSLSAFVVMVRIDPLITVVMAVPLIVMVVITQRLTPRIRHYRQQFRQDTEAVTDFVSESITAMLAVKASGREAAMVKHFAALNRTRRRSALRDSLLRELLRLGNANMGVLSLGLILLLTARALSQEAFSVGDFALFTDYLGRLSWNMAFFGDSLSQHKRAGVAFERMHALLQDAPADETVKGDTLPLKEADMNDNEATQSPLSGRSNVDVSRETLEHLTVTNLCYTYPNGNLGVKNVSFNLKRGSFTVITGRIGSGKTTLLRALLGLTPKVSGDIAWNGQLVNDPASFFVPPRSAYTAQVPRLFSDTLRDNILLDYQRANTQYADTHHDTNRLVTASHLAVLEHDVQRLEHGYHTMVGSRGVKLSGGQIQRSAAARMFARNSDLLVFDDVSSALDVATENRLWQTLFAEHQQPEHQQPEHQQPEHQQHGEHGARDVTCLVVSHRKAALERADNILVMQAGQVVASGKLEYLLETCQEMQYLWSSQT